MNPDSDGNLDDLGDTTKAVTEQAAQPVQDGPDAEKAAQPTDAEPTETTVEKTETERTETVTEKPAESGDDSES